MGWGSRGCDVCGAGDTRLVAMSLRREDHSKVRGQQRPQGPGIHAEGAAHSGEAARGSRTRERDTMEFMFLNVVGGGLWIRGGSRQTPRRPDASWESLGQVLVLRGTNTLSPPCLKRGCGGVTLLSCGYLHPRVSYRHLCPQVMNPRWGEKSLGVHSTERGLIRRPTAGPQGR